MVNSIGTPSFISGNSIYFPISYNSFNIITAQHFAIRSLNCNYQNISFNTINRPSSAYTVNGVEWSKVYGIQGSLLHNADICQNSITNMSSGINFRDDCTLAHAKCNGFTECYRGVDIGKAWLASGNLVGAFALITHPAQQCIGNAWSASSSNPAYVNRVFGIAANYVKWWNYTAYNSPTIRSMPILLILYWFRLLIL